MTMQIKMTPWRILPALSAGVVALLLLYGGYKSLTTTQIIQIASGARGGGYYELGQKLEQILHADFEQQTLEAPVSFQHRDSHGPQENLRLLANREAQLALALEGISVKPKEVGNADIRGLMKLATSNLHIVVAPHLSRQVGRSITQFSDLVADLRPKLGRPLRVYMGSPHGSTHAVMSLILNYYKTSGGTDLGWEVMEQGSYAEAAEGFLHDRLDVVCLLVATGSPAVVTMSKQGILLPLPEAVIEAIHTHRPSLSLQMIPAGAYNKDFPRTAIATLGASDVLIANGQVSNRLAYRIVRTVALHWPELQTGLLLPEDFAKAQLNQNDYFPLHPGAVAYYKGENVPLWPWFEDKIRIIMEHRDIALSVAGGIPTLYTLLYAWYQRRRVTHLMAQIAAMRQQGAIDHATIENIRMHAITLMAQGKLSRESYASLNEFIEAQVRHASTMPDTSKGSNVVNPSSSG